MRRSSLSLVTLALLAAAASRPASLLAQDRIEVRTDRRGTMECFRNSRRVDCESLRADGRVREAERARERALDRARETRERALEQSRVERERALERSRVERERAQDRAAAARRVAEESRRRQIDWAQSLRRDIERDVARERILRSSRRNYDWRPHFSLGGGADIRRFDDVNRYLVNAGVSFTSRYGIGMRPEVVFGWTDRQRETLPLLICPVCAGTPPFTSAAQSVELQSRSKMLGVNLNATYTMLRGSFVRPYLLGGVGVVSTREVVPAIATSTSLSSVPGAAVVSYRTDARDRVDLGLNAGAGMEFGRGPVRLYTEFRYFLNDTPSARGFSGMLPITAGIRF